MTVTIIEEPVQERFEDLWELGDKELQDLAKEGFAAAAPYNNRPDEMPQAVIDQLRQASLAHTLIQERLSERAANGDMAALRL